MSLFSLPILHKQISQMLIFPLQDPIHLNHPLLFPLNSLNHPLLFPLISLPLHLTDHPISIPCKPDLSSTFIYQELTPILLLAHCEPKSVKQALTNPNWLFAMQQEYEALMKNNNWSLVPLPQDRKPIGCKWVFRVKENADGSINKYKARLVAKGFNQVAGFDFSETFSLVIKLV